ncbi:MAG: 2-C-methyl-D-erythritol 4-phosphate cytidylyltransferase [Solirubrobacterales bacterium]|nr:2-C-methyl-D-erythritol 4-phosphate cytidylyltransferase [Solirubrobacterales bacterium]
MAAGLVVAAGSGERLGAAVPKALVPLAGRPMLEWSLLALKAVVSDIVVALPPGTDWSMPGVTTVTGGGVRSESVLAAFEAAPNGDPILVHDAARPLASAALFARTLEELSGSGADAVIAALPVSDTVKRVADGRVVETLDRSQLWAVQTPQVFRRAALQSALRGDLGGATDDASLVEAAGGEVRVVPGEPDNFKITVPADLARAEGMLA